MPGRGSPSTTMMHDVRRSNFSAAPNKRSPHVRTVVDDQRRRTARAQLPTRPQNSPRFEGGEVSNESRILRLLDAARCTSDSPAVAASRPQHPPRASVRAVRPRTPTDGEWSLLTSSIEAIFCDDTPPPKPVTGGPPEPPKRSRTHPAPPISIPKPRGHL